MMETRPGFQPPPGMNLMGTKPYFRPPSGPTPLGMNMMGANPYFHPQPGFTPSGPRMMEPRPTFQPTAWPNNPGRRTFSASGMAGGGNFPPAKKVKVEPPAIPVQPASANFRFSPPPPPNTAPPSPPPPPPPAVPIHKQFWKAGDYGGEPSSGAGNWESHSGSDHIRVHPRFLHSNATSHKWVLGAFAELLDNALDETRNGATFVSIDMIKNKKNGGKMLVIEDNGCGMDPTRMRQCMSLGYSAKSKIANTIGQYGNGFKTSTMRLGADVVVLSRSRGENGKKPTQSVGLLSYTFLRCTHKEDIEVPMIDYERRGDAWEKVNPSDWSSKVNTIVQWSPFSSEADIFEEFNWIQDQGTRIYIYNLWEDDQNELELDFDTDPHDIQIRGANRDEKNIEMAREYPNSRHFLTYNHSLRSYAAILYLNLPQGFRMFLRGKEIEHHNIEDDMMMIEKTTYQPIAKEKANVSKEKANVSKEKANVSKEKANVSKEKANVSKGSDMVVANVTVGFVKDARAHIDIQGFNVYHQNRLIKPFWRVWAPVGSDGRGVIGVLEVNFIKPAHDKQGFEETILLTRLKEKLMKTQRTYWSSRCHDIGYAQRRGKKVNDPNDGPTTPEGSSGSSRENVSLPARRGVGSSKKAKKKATKKATKKANQHPKVSQNAQTTIRPDDDDDDADDVVEEKEDGEISESEADQADEMAGAMSDAKDQQSDLLKDLEQERDKSKLLESDLDQERSKCKALESDLDSERGRSKSLVSEFDAEMGIYKDKCRSLQSELDQERNKLKSLESGFEELNVYKEACKSLELELDLERKKCKSLESENQELASGRDYLIDIFSDALKNSKKQLQQISTSRTVIKHYFHG